MKIDNNYKFYSTPFPHLVFENFLDNDQTQKIVQEISEISNLHSVKKVMGGRFQYQTYHFNKKSLSLTLYNFFNNYDYFNKLNNLLLSQDDENKEFIYDNKFEKITKKRKIIHNILRKFFPSLLKNKFFLHLDFSVAQEEYSREPHHDSNTRIINFLLYLNTLENNNGGALEIYNYKNNDNLIFKRAPNKEDLELNKIISPKAGKLIVFLSSPKSIHGVEIFKPQKSEKRYFIYGGYTSFFDVNWKNINIKKR